jgi:hypothetical protein
VRRELAILAGVRSIATFVIVVFAAAVAPASPLVTEALDAIGSGGEAWAYTQTTVTNGKKTIESFDPSRPEADQWVLVLKNGRAPSPRDLREHRSEHSKRRSPGREKKGSKEALSGLIREGSLELIADAKDAVTYGFRLPAETSEQARLADQLRGLLTIGKGRPHAVTIEIQSEGPIAPFPAVHIESMRTRMEFRPVTAGGPVMPFEMRSSIRGRALKLKSLDTDSVITFTDYRRVVDTAR